MSDHTRNTGPMLDSLRCGAKTRSGKPCQAPAVKGKVRCRMHGGSKGSGAPAGNQNAYKNGNFTQSTREMQKVHRDGLRLLRSYLKIYRED